ncbi:MAG: methyl-accepting chemotaxis protein [Treponema sp.]|jgi:methyl-accepting chemotaxis protein|nr:methyl-accepting chemotaxis protein [Treponema sp.]
MKIKIRLSITVMVIVLIVVAALSTVLLTISSNMALELSVESATRLAQQQASYWQGREEGYIRVIRTVASFMGEYRNIPVEERRSRLNNVMKWALDGEKNMAGIYSVWKPNALDEMDAEYAEQQGYTATGQYAPQYTWEGSDLDFWETPDLAASMAVLNGPNARLDSISEPFIRTIHDHETYVFRMRVPVIDLQTDEVVGIVGCLIDMTPIQGVVEETIKTRTNVTGMIVFSGQGMVMGSGVPAQVGRSMMDANAALFGDQISLAHDAVVNGKPFYTRRYSSAINTTMELILAPCFISNTGVSWSVMIGVDRKIINARITTMTKYSIIIAIAMVIVMAILIYIILSRITAPLIDVALTLKDISEGEGDLTKVVKVKADNEIGDLAIYFNQTLEKIRNLVITIKNQSNSLFTIGHELSTNMTETAASINQIAMNIQTIKNRVLNQSASIDENESTMEQVTMNIKKLHGQVEKQTDQVSQSSTAIQEMLTNIQSVTATLERNAISMKELAEVSEVGRNGLSEVSTNIQEIAKESEGLLEINAVMENIASQTNLLSMNAAIEAAHAGEAGKGFAVVADEIRKLAENSAEQSKTISTVLKKIKESIDKISKSTDNVLENFEAIEGGVQTVSEQAENIRNAMENQNAGSKQILEVMSSLNDITQQVKNGSVEMLDGSQQVISESKNLTAATQEIANSMNEMASGANQINGAVTKVNTLTGDNKENIDVLVGEISKFKVD